MVDAECLREIRGRIFCAAGGIDMPVGDNHVKGIGVDVYCTVL